MAESNLHRLLELSHTHSANLGIDMGEGKWVMGVNDYEYAKRRRHTFVGENYQTDCVAKINEMVDAGYQVQVTCEIGRNGFAPARLIMQECGVGVNVIASSRLEMISSGKRAKSDGIDGDFLSTLDPRLNDRLPLVWIPTLEQEDHRVALSERKRLQTECQRLNNQIISMAQRYQVEQVNTHQEAKSWTAHLAEWQQQGLTNTAALAIKNMIHQLETVEQDMETWENVMDEMHQADQRKAAEAGCYTDVDKLMQFAGIGKRISRGICWYVNDFTRFRNARKISSYFGLTPTPFASGSIAREQGIGKHGNREVRRLMIEAAWLWVRWQPNSALTLKYKPLLEMRGRKRKTAIVAMARQLLTAFYLYLVKGQPIEGACMNMPLA